MKQQINLYLPEFRKEKDFLDFGFICKSMLGLVLILAVLSAVSYWDTRQLETNLLNAQAERDDSIMRVNALLDEFGVQSEDPALSERVRSLEAELTEKRRLLRFMEGRDLGNTDGFSQHLTDLSRYHIPGLRLTNISLARGGEIINLEGQVQRGDLVPLYLQSLSQGITFTGKTFETLRLEGSSDIEGNSLLQFSVVTSNE